MPLMSSSWTLFKLPNSWDLLDLDSILQKIGNLVKCIIAFRNVGVDDLPHEFLIEHCLTEVCFFARVYLVSINEIISSWEQVRNEALLIVNNYFLGFYLNQYFYLFDSYIKVKNGNKSAAGTTVLLTFESCSSLENYIRSVWYANYPMALYFRIQCNGVNCTVTAKNCDMKIVTWKGNTIIISSKKDNIRKKNTLKNHAQRFRYQKKLYHKNPESQKEHEKKKYKKILLKKMEYEKRGIRKILKWEKNIIRKRTRNW